MPRSSGSTACPTRAAMWHDFLACCGGVAVDAPGFGQTGKRADMDYSTRRSTGVSWSASSTTWAGSGAASSCHDWGGAGARLRPARARARGAPRAGRQRAPAARLPLAPHGPAVAGARDRRDRHGDDQPAHRGLGAPARGAARIHGRRGLRPLRPGHPARDSASSTGPRPRTPWPPPGATWPT